MIITDLRKYIIDKSKELGIDIVGFCDAEPFDHLKELLATRRKSCHETEFEEQNIELRVSPRKALPNAKSIIAIGVSYNVEEPPSHKVSTSSLGSLSKSSWGVDYHIVLREKLEELVKEIKKVQNFEYKIYVDTGPLIDREVAKRAGIGWYGKNNSIINDRFGSYIFIGYILTDLEIEVDGITEKQCNDCDICIRACPTSAIGNDNRINATRCISYLTQTKERIPYELRDKMGVKIYGCDTCQACCPINEEALKATSERFIPHKTNGVIDLYDLVELSNRQFKEKYGHIAGSWRGKNILKRNAIIALGNLRDKNSIELLIRSLEDQNSMIREYSAWALIKIDRELGRRKVMEHITKEKDKEVKEELERLLKYYR